MWAWILHRFFNDFGVVLRSEIDVKWDAKRNWSWDRKKKGSRSHKDRPKRCQDAPGRSKASKLEPTWPQEGSQNQSKIDENPSLRVPKTQDPPETPPRFQNGPQNGFQIVAKSTSKSIQNSFTTDAKCACKLFLRHAGMQVCRFAGMEVCRYAGM